MTAPVREGEILAGKYRVERVIGVGGMGVVVAAHHLQLDERVALKFLLPEALENAEAVTRFLREARAAVKIKSEHVARVSDVGVLDSGSPYIVMEYLEGTDLGAVLETRGAVALDDAVDFVLQALEAVAEAHTLGIIHRDLKPANLFVTRRRDGSRCVKVLDFGISKVAGAQGMGSDVTKTSGMLGTPLYMAPEQWASAKSADARSDLWSMGAVLYHLVTGRPPFDGETIPELYHRIMMVSPTPLRNLRPDAPEGLDEVIARCLEKDPARRYRNVTSFAAALAPFASRLGRHSVERISAMFDQAGLSVSASAREVGEAAEAARARSQTTAGAWAATRGGAGTVAGKAGMAAAVVLALAAGATFWMRTRPATRPIAAAATAPVTADSPAVAAPSAAPVAAATDAPATDAPASPPPSAAPPVAPASTPSSAPPRPRLGAAPPKNAARPPTGPVAPAKHKPYEEM